MNVGETPLAAKTQYQFIWFVNMEHITVREKYLSSRKYNSLVREKRLHSLFHQHESKDTRINGTYESLGVNQTRGLALDLGP